MDGKSFPQNPYKHRHESDRVNECPTLSSPRLSTALFTGRTDSQTQAGITGSGAPLSDPVTRFFGTGLARHLGLLHCLAATV